MRKSSLIIIIMLFSTLCFGCEDSRNNIHEDFIYNSTISKTFVDSDNYIYGNITNNKENPITIIQDKVTGKIDNFIRDPFFNHKTVPSYVKDIQINCGENKGYYLDNSKEELNKGFSIMEFDLNSLDSKEIYRQNFIFRKELFLGLSKTSEVKVYKENDFSENKKSNIVDYMKQPKYFVCKDMLYLLKNNGLYRMNLKNKKEEILINEEDIKTICCDGINIYYINKNYEIYKYCIDTKTKNKLTNEKSSYLIASKDKLVYTNLKDKNHIYIMNKNGSENIKICGNSGKNLNFDDEFIYYSNDDDNETLYRVKYDGSCNTKMTSVPAYFIFTFKDYNKVYIWSTDEKTSNIKAFSVNKDNFKLELLNGQ